jgi:peptide/nickel transport system permease protein
VIAFLAGRLVAGAGAVLLVTAALHALMTLAPGDPLAALVGEGVRRLPAEEQARLRAQLGLDEPWLARYGASLATTLGGDLGTSRRSGRPVAHEIGERLPASATLVVVALPVAFLLALAAGGAAAHRPGSWRDAAVTSTVSAAAALPPYLTGLVLLLVFSLWLGLAPASGAGSLAHLVLPAATLALAVAAPWARVTRAALINALAQPHVVVARAKGLSGAPLVKRHALRPALAPLLTLAAMDAGRLLGGAVFVEAIFGWPGLGRLAVDAVGARDLPLLQGIVLVSAVAVVVLNLAADVAMARLDPRVRLG